MAKQFKGIKPVGQFDKMACWAACLSWWLKAAGGGRPALTQMKLIVRFDRLCNEQGSIDARVFMNRIVSVPEFNMDGKFFTASQYRFKGLPVGDDVPVLIVFNYPKVGGTHMNVVFDKHAFTKVWAMEPFFPFPGEDGQRSGKFEERQSSFFLNSPEIGLCWPKVSF